MTSTVRPSPQPLDRSGDGRGALGIEVGSRLVEDDERCVPEERSREGDALPLAGRDRPAPVPDDRAVAVGECANELVGAGEPGCRDDALVVGGRLSQPDVVRDRPVKERRPLWNPRHGTAPGSVIGCRQLGPVDGDAALPSAG